MTTPNDPELAITRLREAGERVERDLDEIGRTIEELHVDLDELDSARRAVVAALGHQRERAEQLARALGESQARKMLGTILRFESEVVHYVRGDAPREPPGPSAGIRERVAEQVALFRARLNESKRVLDRLVDASMSDSR